MPNNVTKNWNQSNAEMRLLAFTAKEGFHYKTNFGSRSDKFEKYLQNHVKKCFSPATLKKINEISHHWNGSATQIKEYQTSFVARVGEDPPNPSDMVLRGPRKSDGQLGHNIIEDQPEPESQPRSTKRLDERLILARYANIKCSLGKIFKSQFLTQMS